MQQTRVIAERSKLINCEKTEMPKHQLNLDQQQMFHLESVQFSCQNQGNRWVFQGEPGKFKLLQNIVDMKSKRRVVTWTFNILLFLFFAEPSSNYYVSINYIRHSAKIAITCDLRIKSMTFVISSHWVIERANFL